jgi:hypothetical protein
MATVEEVAKHVVGLIGDVPILQVATWTAQRIQEVAHSKNLRQAHRTGELRTPAEESTGTIAWTLGSPVITGTSTAFSEDHVGSHLRVGNIWMEIQQVASATSLTLVTDVTEATATGGGVSIIKRFHSLDPEARKLGVFVHMRLRNPLDEVSKAGLDLADPGRFRNTSIPQYVAEIEPHPDTGYLRVEIYPYSPDAEVYHYQYWTDFPLLALRDQVPAKMDIESLREGVLVDAMRWLMTEAASEGKIDLASFWRNEYRAQETRWERLHKQRLLSQDEGTDDAELMLTKKPAHPGTADFGEIRNARDAVWSRSVS